MPKGTKRPKNTGKSLSGTKFKPMSDRDLMKDVKNYSRSSSKPPVKSGGRASGPWGVNPGSGMRSRAGASGFKGPSLMRPKVPTEKY